MKKYSTTALAGLGLLILIGLAGWWWWHQPVAAERSPPMAVGTVSPAMPLTPPVAQAVQPPLSASKPAAVHPIESAPAAQAPSITLSSDPAVLLDSLFGRKALLALFQTEDFARRLVATVDNLGREKASTRLWPLNPAQGRFTVAQRGGADVIALDNGLRYTPHVLLLESVEPRQLAAAYLRLYPQLQRAYEELGYPGRHFNDRMIEVIDQLLATPMPAAPVGVYLPTANSPVIPNRPWVLYAFDDPALQSLSAGQKILLRMGPVNERRVKQRLRALRAQLTVARDGSQQR
jgi:hypothetical protein